MLLPRSERGETETRTINSVGAKMSPNGTAECKTPSKKPIEQKATCHKPHVTGWPVPLRGDT